MAFTDQIQKLVTKLAGLTEQEKVEWEETANPNTYLAPVGKFIITVGKAGPEVCGDYSFQILDQRGKPIDGTSVTYSNPTSEANEYEDWERLRNLHELARRRAMHSDKAISDLLSALDRIA